ncbi:hypothetical protein SAMN05421788_110109 [Filimonas lacunae]|uniref:YD repeat-containing protein n=1 Tax=Filimonas lacunae TaxID=477680 RepID=A0A173MA46_9BACT|nr:hypothetical protein [Filimonas lacunae]BAV04380.1 hypothetical protein FLA_0368 [Filimonas lacunae]SIT31221.1 hypothetical protein SAMN05421788_110109 [Filimonas lacunae]
MNVKSLQWYKTAIAAIITLSTAASCSKSDNSSPVATPAPAYLPSVIYENETAIDSFTYNSNNSVDKIYLSDNSGSNSYYMYFQFSYDASGLCTGAREYTIGSSKLPVLDTLVYSTGKVTWYTFYLSRNETIDLSGEGLEWTLTTDGIVQEGSKDTTRLDGEKRLQYATWTFSAGNLLTYAYTGYVAYSNGSIIENQSLKHTYTCDAKDNGLYWLFKNNPFAGYLLTGRDYSEGLYLSQGKNNFTKILREYTSTDGTTSATFNFTNTYDSESGFVKTQQTVIGDYTSPMHTFYYVKSK